MLVLRALIDIVIGLIFIVAAVAKVSSLNTTAQTLKTFGLIRYQRQASIVLIIIEATLGINLLLGFATIVSHVATLLVLLVFAAIVSVRVMQGHSHACNCFGDVLQSRVSWGLVYRNLTLALLCGIALAIPVDVSPQRIVARLISQTRFDVGLCTFVVALAGLATQAAFALYLVSKQRSSVVHRQPLKGRTLLDFIIQVDGSVSQAFSSILSSDPTMLLFVNKNCIVCERLLARVMHNLPLPRASIALIARDFPDVSSVDSDQRILARICQPHHELALLLGVRTTPSAIVISQNMKFQSELLEGPDKIFRAIEMLSRPKIASHVSQTKTFLASQYVES